VAARASTTTPTYAGPILSCMAKDETADRIAWYKADSGGRSHPVGTKQPNAWGLHDLAGNVYEWTADPYDPAAPAGDRVLRGGSWYHNAEHLRSANRYRLPPHRGLSHVGFRCVRSLPAAG